MASWLAAESAVDGRDGSGRLRSRSINDMRFGDAGAEGMIFVLCVGKPIGSVA